jgi:L-alanine-DL-glutamate epimerase-like enolase superfamily enzyme
MKITGVQTRVVPLPIRPIVVNRSGVFDTMWNVLVDVSTDEGITGSTYLWGYSPAGARSLAEVLVELGEAAIGEDPCFATRLWRRNWQQIQQWGHRGLAVIAMSAIDIAAWDIVGKATERPLAHLLGANSDRVHVYASEGLWLDRDPAALAREADELVGRGFRGVKMRLGRPRMADDLAAVAAVREAIGPDVALMIDVNQGWDVAYAIRIGRHLEEFGLSWLEEPTQHDDLAGHAQIAAALDTPIASGEKLYSPQGLREAMEARAFDIAMPDVERIGGVTGWMRTAALAEAWNLPVCSHLFPEVSLHLMAASPTGTWLEHVPWTAPLFNETLDVADGLATVPLRPGFGFTWDEAAIGRLSDTS